MVRYVARKQTAYRERTIAEARYPLKGYILYECQKKNAISAGGASFVKNYDYLCKHPFLPAIIHTNHKPLTYFLSSDLHKGINGHWVDQLRRLNIKTKYIPRHRDKVANGLLRTLYNTDDYSSSK